MLAKLRLIYEIAKVAWTIWKHLEKAIDIAKSEKEIEKALNNKDRKQAAADIANSL